MRVHSLKQISSMAILKKNEYDIPSHQVSEAEFSDSLLTGDSFEASKSGELLHGLHPICNQYDGVSPDILHGILLELLESHNNYEALSLPPPLNLEDCELQSNG